jgi:hypothetical protein
MPARLLPDWTRDAPFQIKGGAAKAARAALSGRLAKPTKAASGKPAAFRFRGRKGPPQSRFIPKTASGKSGIRPQGAGKGLACSEPLPAPCPDSRPAWKAGKFYWAVPAKRRAPYGGNQARGVVAAGPGARTAAAFHAAGSCGLIGSGDFSRTHGMARRLGGLISRAAKSAKSYWRIAPQAALFLVRNVACILLPRFEAFQTAGRAIGKRRFPDSSAQRGNAAPFVISLWPVLLAPRRF